MIYNQHNPTVTVISCNGNCRFSGVWRLFLSSVKSLYGRNV